MSASSLLTACLLCATSLSAFAQSSVTLYGLVDIGIAHERGGAKPVTKLDGSGMHSGNRIGFRGTEDLGHGNSVVFVLENGFDPSTGAFTQGGLGYGRQAFLGVKGAWGQVTAGRQYSPHWSAINNLDPMDGIIQGTFNLARRTVRTDRTLMYTSPKVAGFSAQLSYGFGDVEGNSKAKRMLGGSLTYAHGPLSVSLAHHNGKNDTGTDTTRNTYLGASYSWGLVKAIAGYQVETGPGAWDARVAQLGAQFQLPAGTLMALYVRKDDRTLTNNNAQLLGVAYTYPLSKRTNLYAAAMKIKNDHALVYRTKAGDGSGDREFSVGIRHRF